MKRRKSLPPLDRLKNLRWTGGPSRESDWSRNIPVIWWFSSQGTIFWETLVSLSLSDHSVSSNWHFIRLEMINTPWHSFHARREGHWYLLLDSEISFNLSKTQMGWYSQNKTFVDPGLQTSVKSVFKWLLHKKYFTACLDCTIAFWVPSM